MTRTDRPPQRNSGSLLLPVMDAEFAEDGYIRVYQDIRGLQSRPVRHESPDRRAAQQTGSTRAPTPTPSTGW
jgi:hypothetical protein